MYKNTEKVNNLFKSGNNLIYRLNYKNVFTSSQNFIFDEPLGIHLINRGSNLLKFKMI
ncbi:DUF6625 family protein [Streptococcus suis]|uniref:DUF6625 family protein n=1 Tax=Streptococcus suis TaxID=1307 RepID=UPI002ED62580